MKYQGYEDVKKTKLVRLKQEMNPKISIALNFELMKNKRIY